MFEKMDFFVNKKMKKNKLSRFYAGYRGKSQQMRISYFYACFFSAWKKYFDVCKIFYNFDLFLCLFHDF